MLTRLLTVDTTGAISLKAHPSFTPPLGLTLPQSQDVQATIPGTRTLATLFASEQPVNGTEVITNGAIYVVHDGVWYDSSTFSDASSVSISGLITLRNNAAFDIGVTW